MDRDAELTGKKHVRNRGSDKKSCLPTLDNVPSCVLSDRTIVMIIVSQSLSAIEFEFIARFQVLIDETELMFAIRDTIVTTIEDSDALAFESDFTNSSIIVACDFGSRLNE